MKHWRWVLGGISGIGFLILGLVLVIPLLAEVSNSQINSTGALEVQLISQANLQNGTVYVVRPGDTLFGISRRYGVTVQAIVEMNQLPDARLIHIGQSLVIPSNTAVQPQPSALPPNPEQPETQPTAELPAPTIQPLPTPQPVNGTTYFVRRGDSLYLIARRFRTTITAIIAANQIANPNFIYVGQQLIIPAGNGNPVAEPPTAVPLPTQPLPTPDLPAPTVAAPPSPTPVTSDFGLIWPNDYRGLYQRFRYGHGAIDIAMPVGTAVLASAAGTIEFAGWHNAGFGYLVIVDHNNGTRTLYAHNSELLVTYGQQVAQGEQIARSGSTGNSTHPHLHFSITENGRLIDPCFRLPGGC